MMGLTAMAQTISIEDVTLNANESANIGVKLTGGSTFIAIGFSVELPDGFSFTGDVSNGTDSHVIKSYLISDNVMKVAVYSGKNTSFGSNDKELLRLGVKAGIKSGTYQGKIKGIEFSDSSNGLVTKANVVFTISVNGILGDVNSDGKVDIVDVTCIVNYIMGQNQSTFNLYAADMDGDGNVNISDVVLLVSYILGRGM